MENKKCDPSGASPPRGGLGAGLGGKEQLVREVKELRQRIAELEALAVAQSVGSQGEAILEAVAASGHRLRESEEHYRSLFDNVAMGFYRSTPAGQLLDVNLALVDILGYPDRESLLAVNAVDLYVDAHERQRWQAVVEREGIVPGWEGQLRRLDGAVIWISDNVQAVRDQDGQVLYYEGTLEDITNRVRVEEALRRRNRELALLNRAAQVFSSSLDLDQVLVTVLKEVRRLLGAIACSAWLIDPGTEEVVCRQVTDPDSEVVRGWRLALGQGIVGWVAQHGESLIVPDTRTDERHFKGVDQQTGLEIRSILCVPLGLKQRVIGVILLGDQRVNGFGETDVRLVESLASAAAIAIENARLYEDLRASQEYTRNLIESSLDTIIAVDMNRKIVEFNRAAQDTFGYRPQEILGQHIDILYVDPREGQEIHNTTVEQGKCICEVLNKRKNGQEFPIFLSASVLRDARGELVGVMGVSRDITERVQAEERLKASLHEKEVLLKEIHHRVKNNLQLISSLLDLQSDYVEDPQARTIFAESQHRVRSIALIHEQLYKSPNLARIDCGRHIRDLASRLFHLYGVVPDTVTLDIHVDHVFLGIDNAIPCGLIINELLSNSLKYAFPGLIEGSSVPRRAAEGDKVRIEMNRDDDHMLLIVGDNGGGLPPEIDFPHTDTLGLQLVEMLTQQLKGTVELDRDRGTTFKITFPCEK